MLRNTRNMSGDKNTNINIGNIPLTKRLKLNTITIQFMTYFIIISICTSLASFISYKYVTRIIEDNAIKYNTQLLNQFKNTVEGHILGNVDKLSISIIQNNLRTNDILYFFNNEDTEISRFKNIYDYLTYLKSLNPIVDSIAIYSKKNNIIITTEGIKFLSVLSKPDWIDYSWVASIYSDYKNMKWLDTRKVKNPTIPIDSYKNIISLVRTYPFSSNPENSLGAVSISLTEEALYNTIKDYAPVDFGQMVIVNKDGVIISHTEKQYIYTDINESNEYRQALHSKEKGGYYISKATNSNSVVSYSSSEYNNWKYIANKPIEQYTEGYKILAQIILTITLFIIIIGFLLSLLSAKELNTPLKKLVNLSKVIVNPPADSLFKNEYDIIGSTLNLLANKISNEEMKLKEYVPVIKYHLTLKLINNGYKNIGDIYNQLDLLKINFNFDYYMVFLIKVSNNTNSIDTKTLQYLKLSIIDHTQNSLSTDYSDCICTEEDNEYSKIIGIINVKKDYFNILLGNLNELSLKLSNQKDCIISMSLGSLSSDLLNIRESYVKAEEFLLYSYIYPEKDLITLYNFVNKEHSNSSRRTKKILDILAVALNQQDRELFSSSLQCLISAIREDELSHSNINCILNYLTKLVENYAEKYNISTANIISKDIKNEIEKTKNIYDLEKWFNNIIDYIFSVITNSYQDRNSRLIEKVKEYLQDNICSQDLSLNNVSEEMGLSPNYLSLLFKEETGMKFIDYIVDMKLEMALDLLMRKNIKVKDISIKAGYSSPEYFIRKFKNKYGMTPTDYKRNHRILDKNNTLPDIRNEIEVL